MTTEETGQIHLGGRTYPVRSFTFDELQVVLPILERIEGTFSPGCVAAYRDALFYALTLNGHGTEDELKAMKVRIDEVVDAVAVISSLSGLKALGERVAQMRMAALMRAGLLTGSGSTQASAPTQDGTGEQSED